MAHELLPFPTVRPDRGVDRNDDRGDDERHADPPLRDLIGEVLRDERLDQDRTLAEVAREAAVSLPYLSEVERGRKEVSSDVLAAICDALDLPLADVLERSAERLRPSMRGGSAMMLLAA
jgi:DNA-binding Xre family transcriptional regulator